MEQNRNITEALAILQGTWTFGRRADGGHAMAGTAVFSQEANGLFYKESGTHTLPGGLSLEFHRAYSYRDKDGALWAFFDDGRPFHEFMFERRSGTLCARAFHLCGNDRYSGEYVFHAPDNFSLTWDVQGPRKNYIIKTNYIRQAEC